ncbi:hypothetical protein GCM10027048_12230 [Hymenobacter coalescens]
MTPLQLRPSSFDEMLFEGRNKAYGAFDLRRNYPVHVRRALTIALLLFALLAAAPMVTRLFMPAPAAPPVLPSKEVEFTDVTFKVEEPKPEAATPVASTAKPMATYHVPTRVVPNEQAKPQAVPAVEPLDAMPSTTPSVGTGTVPVDGTVNLPGTGLTPGAGTGPAAPAAKPEVFLSVEHMPEFVGGQEAMLQYLRRNMHYPARALRDQVEGKVYVAFTVSATGDIVDVEVIKGLGSGTDEEALRVVRNMPRWQAGEQNGHPVAVRYTLPITFRFSH